MADRTSLTGWSERRFLAFDETPIFYRRFRPDSGIKATVLVVHGMGEHGGRYHLTAEALGAMGCQSILPDLRGFGKSGGKRASVGSFSDYDHDLAALHSLAVEEEKGLPFFLLGHSLGGLIASAYTAFAKHPPLNGLILSSPCFGLAVKVPPLKHWLGILSASFLPDFTQNSGLNPDCLTHDKQVVERYKNDPLISYRVSARLYREMLQTLNSKENIASRIACPVLILQAGMDTIVSREATLSFYEKLKTNSKEIEIYDGFYHEVLNEVNRGSVLTRIGEWIQRVSSHNLFV